MKKLSEADKLRLELALFVKKMQQAGINIQAIKKPTDVGASIGIPTQRVFESTS